MSKCCVYQLEKTCCGIPCVTATSLFILQDRATIILYLQFWSYDGLWKFPRFVVIEARKPNLSMRSIPMKQHVLRGRQCQRDEVLFDWNTVKHQSLIFVVWPFGGEYQHIAQTRCSLSKAGNLWLEMVIKLLQEALFTLLSPQQIIRKILVSVKFVSAILGPEMGAPILWTPGKMRSFCRKNHVRKIPLFWGGGGKCRFYFYGRADFSEIRLNIHLCVWCFAVGWIFQTK